MLLLLLLLLVLSTAAATALTATPAAPVTSSSVASVVETGAAASSTALILAAVAVLVLSAAAATSIASRRVALVSGPTATTSALLIAAGIRRGWGEWRRRLAARVGLRVVGDGWPLSFDVWRRGRRSRRRRRWWSGRLGRRFGFECRALVAFRPRRVGRSRFARRWFNVGHRQRRAACFDFVAVWIFCFGVGRAGRTAATATARWASTFAHADGSIKKGDADSAFAETARRATGKRKTRIA